jgi:hypothetical protein
MDENHDLMDSMISHLFGQSSIYFYQLFKFINEPDPGIMPDRVNLIYLLNLNTDVLVTHVEEGYPENLYINVSNRFVGLIYKYKDQIYENNRNLLKELFSYLRDESDINLSKIHDEQKTILKWLFMNISQLDENDIGTYLLSERDIEGCGYPSRSRDYL